MITSYHVHSTFSDGSTEIEALVEGANALGLDELGISDHYVVLPDGEACSWSMGIDQLADYLTTIEKASAYARPELRVLKGLEADYIPETVTELKDRLAPHRFDYIIGSVHFVDGFPIDQNAENWDRLTQDERNDLIRTYWSRIAGMARAGIYSFAGHLDLYKKFGHRPSIDVSREIDEALDAIAASGMAVEINTAGLCYPAGEAYPSPTILKACIRRGVPIVINADAHAPENLTRGYDRAMKLLTSSAYPPRKLWKPA